MNKTIPQRPPTQSNIVAGPWPELAACADPLTTSETFEMIAKLADRTGSDGIAWRIRQANADVRVMERAIDDALAADIERGRRRAAELTIPAVPLGVERRR